MRSARILSTLVAAAAVFVGCGESGSSTFGEVDVPDRAPTEGDSLDGMVNDLAYRARLLEQADAERADGDRVGVMARAVFMASSLYDVETMEALGPGGVDIGARSRDCTVFDPAPEFDAVAAAARAVSDDGEGPSSLDRSDVLPGQCGDTRYVLVTWKVGTTHTMIELRSIDDGEWFDPDLDDYAGCELPPPLYRAWRLAGGACSGS